MNPAQPNCINSESNIGFYLILRVPVPPKHWMLWKIWLVIAFMPPRSNSVFKMFYSAWSALLARCVSVAVARRPCDVAVGRQTTRHIWRGRRQCRRAAAADAPQPGYQMAPDGNLVNLHRRVVSILPGEQRPQSALGYLVASTSQAGWPSDRHLIRLPTK